MKQNLALRVSRINIFNVVLAISKISIGTWSLWALLSDGINNAGDVISSMPFARYRGRKKSPIQSTNNDMNGWSVAPFFCRVSSWSWDWDCSLMESPQS